MISRCQIRSSLRGTFTPYHIRKKREGKLFPLFTHKKEKINSIDELHDYICTLEGQDPVRDILNQFPEYLFQDNLTSEYLNLYAESKELGVPAFSGSLKDFPATYRDFIKLLMLERNNQQNEA